MKLNAAFIQLQRHRFSMFSSTSHDREDAQKSKQRWRAVLAQAISQRILISLTKILMIILTNLTNEEISIECSSNVSISDFFLVLN